MIAAIDNALRLERSSGSSSDVINTTNCHNISTLDGRSSKSRCQCSARSLGKLISIVIISSNPSS